MIHFVFAIAILAILIFVHELGHFLIAKYQDVAVLEFAIGFGRKVFSKKIGETEYSVRLIPLGGFVRMAGDDPAVVYGEQVQRTEGVLVGSADAASIDSTIPRDRWFLSKGLWPRASVVLAGPLFNLAFAWILAVSGLYIFGKPVEIKDPIIGAVFPGYPAEKAGLLAGDKVLEIDGKPIADWDELSSTVRASGGKPISLKVSRTIDNTPNKELVLSLSAMPDTAEMQLLDNGAPKAEKTEEKPFKIGIVKQVGREKATIMESLEQGSAQVWYISAQTVKVLKALVMGAIAPQKVLGGPISVISGAADSSKRGLESEMDFMVLLSISLFIFNLLPVPILDGGHLLFFLIEGIKGSPLNIRWMTIANQVGMALLLGLMLFALSNDLLRLL